MGSSHRGGGRVAGPGVCWASEAQAGGELSRERGVMRTRRRGRGGFPREHCRDREQG